MKTIVPHIRRLSPHAPSRPAAATTPAASVKLQIETLVLHGFTTAEGRRIGSALQSELTRLTAIGGLDALRSRSPSRDLIQGGTVAVVPARVEATGIRLANAIYGGLTA